MRLTSQPCEITSVVDQVAFQHDLLALSSAVEAAFVNNCRSSAHGGIRGREMKIQKAVSRVEGPTRPDNRRLETGAKTDAGMSSLYQLVERIRLADKDSPTVAGSRVSVRRA